MLTAMLLLVLIYLIRYYSNRTLQENTRIHMHYIITHVLLDLVVMVLVTKRE